MINFTKMQALGNDYIYVMLENENKLGNLSKLAIRLSNRNFGIGSDGLIIIVKNKITGNYKMRIFNADGSEANMCGNGIRCVSKYLYDCRYIKNKKFNIETNSGIKSVEVFTNKFDLVENVKVNIGKAKIIKTSDIVLDYDEFEITMVDIGNFHGVVFVKNDTDFYVKKYGKMISEKYDKNIEFVQIIDDNNLRVSVYERGSGITLACGTGASASYFVAYKNGYVKDRGTVILDGGKLNIEIDNNEVTIIGEAKKVFDGIYY